MKFIVDTQLPPKLSNLLRHLGYDSVHTTDYSNGHLMNDYEIIEIAKVESRIIVTKVRTFLIITFCLVHHPVFYLLR